jgi:hypothetical protein
MTVAAHTLDRRHADAVCYNGRTFATEGICDHNHKLDVALGDWHAAAGLFSLSSFAAYAYSGAVAVCRCFPVCPPIAVSTARHRERPPPHFFFRVACFFTDVAAEKGSSSSTASQIRMHRTNPHCAHA